MLLVLKMLRLTSIVNDIYNTITYSFQQRLYLKFRCTVFKRIVFSLSHVITITHFSIQDGYTALRTASFSGHHKVVELLLGAGANPDQQDKVRTGWDSGLYLTLMALHAFCEPRTSIDNLTSMLVSMLS